MATYLIVSVQPGVAVTPETTALTHGVIIEMMNLIPQVVD